MNPQSDQPHYVRRVVLPSGKTIEVVYFEDQVVNTVGGGSPLADPAEDLHVCAECDSELVYPVDWEEAGPSHWEVSLRCPNCEWTGVGIHAQDAVEHFDEELDRGTEALVRDLRRLMHSNMEDDIDRFTQALQDGHIMPEDF